MASRPLRLHVRSGRETDRAVENRRSTTAVHAARRALVATVAIAGATAGFVAAVTGGQLKWLCVPAALLAAATTRATPTGLAAGATVIGATIATEMATGGTHGRPSSAVLALVAAASVCVLLAMRERLTRERDALRASALTDPLTGAANRRALLARIDYEIARHSRTRHRFALLTLDLDGFKALNDRFGHPAGDDLLREVAGALALVVRDQDTVARVGGDEFCVLAPETDEAGAERLIGRAETAVARVVAGADSLGASAGAAVFPPDGRSADEQFEAADQRLLAAKRERRVKGRAAA